VSHNLLKKNESYVLRYRCWNEGNSDFEYRTDTFLVLDYKLDFGIIGKYLLKPLVGEKVWIEELKIVYSTEVGSIYNARTHQDVEDSFFQFKDEHKPDWYVHLVKKYGCQNVSFRSKTGWVVYPNESDDFRSPLPQNDRFEFDKFSIREGVHTEYENDFLLYSLWKRNGKDTWIEKKGKYDESYREHYFPGEKERFLQEVYAAKLNSVWDFLESIGVYVEKFTIADDNSVRGLPSREAIDFVKEQNLEKGVYRKFQ